MSSINNLDWNIDRCRFSFTLRQRARSWLILSYSYWIIRDDTYRMGHVTYLWAEIRKIGLYRVIKDIEIPWYSQLNYYNLTLNLILIPTRDYFLVEYNTFHTGCNQFNHSRILCTLHYIPSIFSKIFLNTLVKPRVPSYS